MIIYQVITAIFRSNKDDIALERVIRDWSGHDSNVGARAVSRLSMDIDVLVDYPLREKIKFKVLI